MTDRLKDKGEIATGTGAVGPGWGNGKAISVLFAHEGAKVFGLDIDPAAAEETRRIVEAEGGTCAVHVADVSMGAEVDAFVKACMNTFGRVDVLVNNVGIAVVGGPPELNEATWDQIMSVNLKSVYLQGNRTWILLDL
jgi:NAD(P)-dependent dehydrogenase (short-subunit alcohol dehydrogenase family)